MTRNIRFLASWARTEGEPSILPGMAIVLAGWALIYAAGCVL